jgi:hypothetical protein
MDLVALYQATGTATKLAGFVEGGGLLAELTTVGDVELKAAQHALERAGRAADIRAEVWLAVGHLQSAHQAFRRLYALEREERNISWGMRSAYDDAEAARKDFWVCIWIGVCDRYLGEAENMRDSFDLAEEALRGFYDPDLYDAIQRERRLSGETDDGSLKRAGRIARQSPDLVFDWLGKLTLDVARSALHPVHTARLMFQSGPGPAVPSPAAFASYRGEQEQQLPLAGP